MKKTRAVVTASCSGTVVEAEIDDAVVGSEKFAVQTDLEGAMGHEAAELVPFVAAVAQTI